MEPIHLFDLANRQIRWLSTNQTVIAGNIANASTPGYRAQAVASFSETLDKTSLPMAATNGAHLTLDPIQADAAAITEQPAWEVTDSGNSVSLEQELIKANDVNRAYSLNTNLVKAFHGMLMSAVKS